MPASVPRREESSGEDLDALARRAGDGDAEAFDELVRRIHARIYRWALIRVADPDDADDVAQTVLVRLHRKLGTWRGPGRFTTWLYRVTANECSSWRRRLLRRVSGRERIRREAERRDAAGSEGTGPGATEPPSLPSEIEELVGHYFGELPERQREVFDLVDIQGYRPAEVSEMLQLNANTVRANLLKARRSMRARILESHPHVVEDAG